MKKWDFRTVRDYIKGLDLDFDVNELENDTNFMMSVLGVTRDKKMYDFCSDNVKKDFEFCKFVIKLFCIDEDFISMVANNFIYSTTEDREILEMSLIMKEYIKDEDLLFAYDIMAATIYNAVLTDLELAKKEIFEELRLEITDELGFGFILDEFVGSKLSIDFFAKEFLNSIFIENKSDLIKTAVSNFGSFLELEEYGLNKFIIDVVKEYDPELALFMESNVYLFDYLKPAFNTIKFNWNSYIISFEREKYDLMFEKVIEYMDNNDGYLYFSYEDIMYFVAEELGIKDKLIKYDINDEMPDLNFTLCKEKMNLMELKIYMNVKKIMLSILNDEEIEETVNKNSERCCKVYEFNSYIRN